MYSPRPLTDLDVKESPGGVAVGCYMRRITDRAWIIGSSRSEWWGTPEGNAATAGAGSGSSILPVATKIIAARRGNAMSLKIGQADAERDNALKVLMNVVKTYALFILIHRGNMAADTSGCILVGENLEQGKVLNSTPYELRLTALIREATERGEQTFIHIVQPAGL